MSLEVHVLKIIVI